MSMPERPKNTCPICGEPATIQCRCPTMHSECANGHYWHYEWYVKVVDGKPPHAEQAGER